MKGPFRIAYRWPCGCSRNQPFGADLGRRRRKDRVERGFSRSLLQVGAEFISMADGRPATAAAIVRSKALGRRRTGRREPATCNQTPSPGDRRANVQRNRSRWPADSDGRIAVLRNGPAMHHGVRWRFERGAAPGRSWRARPAGAARAADAAGPRWGRSSCLRGIRLQPSCHGSEIRLEVFAGEVSIRFTQPLSSRATS